MGGTFVVETYQAEEGQDASEQSTDILSNNRQYKREYSDEGVFRL